MQYTIYIFTERAHQKSITTNRAAAMQTLQNAKDLDVVKMALVYEDNYLLEAYMKRATNNPTQEILEP